MANSHSWDDSGAREGHAMSRDLLSRSDPLEVVGARKDTAGRADNPGGSHIPALDGFRGLAILLVLVHHFLQNAQGTLLADQALTAAAGWCWVGVDLFFVLSGFLITGILYDAKGATNYFRAFYVRRLLRIFPLYYAALLIGFVLLPCLGLDLVSVPIGRRWWFWWHGSNVLTAVTGWQPRPIGHFWSLALEEQFYLVWPLLVFVLSRRALLGVLTATVVGAAGLRVVLASHAVDPRFIYVFTLTRLDDLALGGILALLARSPGGLAAQRNRLIALVPIAAVLLLRLFRADGGLHWPAWGRFAQGYGYSLVGGLAALLLALTLSRPSGVLAHLFSSPFLRFWGRHSYAIYVLHMPVDVAGRALGLHPSAHGGPVGSGWFLPWALAFVVGAGGISAVGGWLSWHLFEKHFLKLKRWVPYRWKEGTRSASEARDQRPKEAPTEGCPRTGILVSSGHRAA
jgi:peptidoglycan/LPS O-acetylase OafA/YrhL